MAAAFRNKTSGTAAVGVGSITLAKPTGTASGDGMVAGFSQDTSFTTTVTWPAAFTALAASPKISTVDGQTLSVAKQIAGGSEPANYTISSDGTQEISAFIAAWSGTDGTTLEDVAGSGNSQASSTTPATFDATGITTVTDGCALVHIGASDLTVAGTETWTDPTGFTNRVTQGSARNFMTIWMSDQTQSTHGATGTVSGSDSFAGGGATGRLSFLLALRPAASAAVVDTATGMVGRLTPTRHYVNRALRQNEPQDTSNITGQTHTPSDIPRGFTPTRHYVNRVLRQNESQDTSNITGQIPSDLSWTPPFRVPRHVLFRQLREAAALDVTVPLQPEDNVYTIDAFRAPWHQLNRRLLQNDPQDSSNITGQIPSDLSWTPRFAPGHYVLTLALWQNPAGDVSQPVQPSSDLSWAGKFSIPWSRLSRQLRQNEPQDTSNTTGQIPSDLSWAPSFKAPWSWVTRALRENPAGDVPIVQEVPVDLSAVVGSFKAPHAVLLRQMWQNEAQDSSTLTPQTPVDLSAVAGKFRAPMPWLNRALWQNPAVDYAVAPPDTGTHSGPNRMALIALYTDSFRRAQERREAEREAELESRRRERGARGLIKRVLHQATLQPRPPERTPRPLEPLLPPYPPAPGVELPTVAEIVSHLTRGLPTEGELRELDAELKELQRKQRRRKTEEEVILHLIQTGAL